MSREEFLKLKIGDVIRSIRCGEIYVVHGHTCGLVMASREVSVCEPDQWELVPISVCEQARDIALRQYEPVIFAARIAPALGLVSLISVSSAQAILEKFDMLSTGRIQRVAEVIDREHFASPKAMELLERAERELGLIIAPSDRRSSLLTDIRAALAKARGEEPKHA